jgi:hypothetical protein
MNRAVVQLKKPDVGPFDVAITRGVSRKELTKCYKNNGSQ